MKKVVKSVILITLVSLAVVSCKKEEMSEIPSNNSTPQFKQDPDDDKIWRGEGAPFLMARVVGTELWDCMPTVQDCLATITLTGGIELDADDFDNVVLSNDISLSVSFFSTQSNWENIIPELMLQPEALQSLVAGSHKFIRRPSPEGKRLYSLVESSVDANSFSLDDSHITIQFTES